MIKPKLLVIVGAGASIDFGMPSVSDIDKLFHDWALQKFPLVDHPGQSLYSFVKNTVKKYCEQNKRNSVDSLTGFESILYTMQSLEALLSEKDYLAFNNRISPFIDIKEFPRTIEFNNIITANALSFSSLRSGLVDKLLNHVRKICINLNQDKSELLAKQTEFYKALSNHYEIGFINLNYDNVILSSLPNLETGFSKNTYKIDRSIIYKNNWGFCYHIHGSVHFDMVGGDNNTEMHKIRWNKNLNSLFAQNAGGRGTKPSLEGLKHLTSNILAGLDKPTQIQREPFNTYFAQVERLIYESDRIMFVGYGFNDEHLNNLFQFIRYDETKIRKPLIITWGCDTDDSLSFRQDRWSAGVSHTIPYNSFEMGDGVYRRHCSIPELKSKKEFERSSNPDYPLSIWYNGISEAFNYPDKFIRELA